MRIPEGFTFEQVQQALSFWRAIKGSKAATQVLSYMENFRIIRLRHHWTCIALVTGAPADACSCGASKSQEGYGRLTLTGSNIVTNAGDTHYAQGYCDGLGGTAPTVTNSFTTLEFANNSGTNPAPAKANHRGSMASIVAGSQKAVSSGYPRVDDPDSDNAGAGSDIITWSFSHSAADFNATGISDLWITNASPGASEPILNHADENVWSPSGVFTKAATDTLKTIVNHTLNGV